MPIGLMQADSSQRFEGVAPLGGEGLGGEGMGRQQPWPVAATGLLQSDNSQRF